MTGQINQHEEIAMSEASTEQKEFKDYMERWGTYTDISQGIKCNEDGTVEIRTPLDLDVATYAKNTTKDLENERAPRGWEIIGVRIDAKEGGFRNSGVASITATCWRDPIENQFDGLEEEEQERSHQNEAKRRMEQKIKFDFVPTNVHVRWPCDVCGGHTEKGGILTQVAEGEWEGLRVCEQCLKAGQGKVDERLEAYAERLEAMARDRRALIGRLELPSYKEWQKAMRHNEEAISRDMRVAEIEHLQSEVVSLRNRLHKLAPDETISSLDDDLPF